MRVPPSQDAPQTWQDGRCDCRTRTEHDRLCFTRDRATIRNTDNDDADRIERRVAGALQSPGIKAVVEVVEDETRELRAERDEAWRYLGAVERLCDEWAADYPGPGAAWNGTPDEWWRVLRAVLGGKP